MAAIFVLSLDCEGKWGAADHLTAAHRRHLGDEHLTAAYNSVLSALDEYEVAATFAFVGAFTQSRSGFAAIRPQLEALSMSAPAYLGPALRDIDERGGDGWHGNHLVDAVLDARSGHEIALHGTTHVPWTAVDGDFARAELSLAAKLQGPVRDSRTFVYPRNLVSHVGVLAEHGFAGYRQARPRRSRLASLLSEFDLAARPDPAISSEGIVEIPAGYFLNWRHGLRTIVPPQVTIARARRLLNAAEREGGVVHYWLHPENIASAPSTVTLLRALLREVARRRDSGHCQVLTQVGYCRWVESLR